MLPDLSKFREINVLNIRPLMDIRREHDWTMKPTPELNMWRIEMYALLADQLYAAWKLKNANANDVTVILE